MSTAPTASSRPTTSGASWDVSHLVCCDDNLSLCGLDVTEEPWDVPGDKECVVCADLEPLPCRPTCTAVES